MEGRPPSFDEEDELDFDFGASRERHPETGDLPLPRPRTPAGPYEGEELPSEEFPPAPEDDPFADEPEPAERRRERRPREGGGLGGLIGTLLGRRRRDRERERPRERAAPDLEPGTGEGRLRDDPFTPAEVPVPHERRRHRRDLPAKVRRRQVIAVGVIAALVLGGGVLLFASGGGDDAEEPLALKRLVGQTMITRLAEETPDQRLLQRARRGQIGGVIVSPRGGEANEQLLQQGLAQLQQAASDGGNPPLLVMVDQEGGDISR